MNTDDSGSGSDVSVAETDPPRKKLKKIRYNQKYSSIWEIEPNYKGWLKSSSKGNEYFSCKVCRSDLKCGSGKKDIDKHAKSIKHISLVKDAVNQPAINSILPENCQKSNKDKIMAGEIKITSFLVEHNLPFNVSDHLTKLIQAVCSDSKIAPELKCGRTKVQAIVTNVMGKSAENNLVSLLQKNKFSIIVDESTDKSKIKHLAILARTAINFKIKDNFLGLLPIIDGTADTLYDKLLEFFKSKNIPYLENMIGFAADGANVNFGDKHSLSTLFTDDIPHLFTMKCICHSFHLCASYACGKLPKEVEDFARDVYKYIQNSPKRFGDYTDFQKFVEVEPHKLLHPSQTRCLSLLPVVERLLEQLPALILFFQSAVLIDHLAAAQSILDKCMEPSIELYLEFLKFVLPYFHDLNKEMQSESSKLYLLYDKIFITYKTILECFLKPECLELSDKKQKNTCDVDEALEQKILAIDIFNAKNHLNLEEIYLGGNVMATLELRKNLSKEDINQFRETCLAFYLESIKQLKDRFPFDKNQQIKSLSFLNPETLLDPNLKKRKPSIANLGALFPVLCPANLTELDREWRLLRNTKLPFTRENNVRVDEFWDHISRITKGDGSKMFPLLASFTEVLLCLPHSSANVERLFSSINMMKTNIRNQLSTNTLTGLLFTKNDLETPYYDIKLTEDYKKLFKTNMYDFKQKKKISHSIEDNDSDN